MFATSFRPPPARRFSRKIRVHFPSTAKLLIMNPGKINNHNIGQGVKSSHMYRWMCNCMEKIEFSRDSEWSKTTTKVVRRVLLEGSSSDEGCIFK